MTKASNTTTANQKYIKKGQAESLCILCNGNDAVKRYDAGIIEVSIGSHTNTETFPSTDGALKEIEKIRRKTIISFAYYDETATFRHRKSPTVHYKSYQLVPTSKVQLCDKCICKRTAYTVLLSCLTAIVYLCISGLLWYFVLTGDLSGENKDRFLLLFWCGLPAVVLLVFPVGYLIMNSFKLVFLDGEIERGDNAARGVAWGLRHTIWPRRKGESRIDGLR